MRARATRMATWACTASSLALNSSVCASVSSDSGGLPDVEALTPRAVRGFSGGQAPGRRLEARPRRALGEHGVDDLGAHGVEQLTPLGLGTLPPAPARCRRDRPRRRARCDHQVAERLRLHLQKPEVAGAAGQAGGRRNRPLCAAAGRMRSETAPLAAGTCRLRPRSSWSAPLARIGECRKTARSNGTSPARSSYRSNDSRRVATPRHRVVLARPTVHRRR